MKKTFIAVGVASLLGLTSVAQAAEFNWSGSIRAGYTSRDEGGGVKRQIGGDASSRINLNASTDLGNGQSAGAELSYNFGDVVEKHTTNDATDSKAKIVTGVKVRRQNIWLSGAWGKLTLGKHGGIYRDAANWDQSGYLGGKVRHEARPGGGATGVIYSSNIAGPFGFKIEVASANNKTIGDWAAVAAYDLGPATLNLGYNNADMSAKYKNNTAVSVNGSAGDFGYYVAYEISKHAGKNSANKDANTVGIFLSYNVGDNRFYVEYENAKVDNVTDDPNATLFGYRLDLGAGVEFTAEYVTFDQEAKDKDKKELNLTLKYDF